MAVKGWSLGALAKAIRSLAFWEPVDVYKAIYPVGIVVMFDSNTDPNIAWPGTTWVQIKDSGSVRAAYDSSVIGQLIGVDKYNLTVAQLPSHGHSWSGSVSETDLGNKTAGSVDLGRREVEEAGWHDHDAGLGAPGASWAAYVVGSDNDSNRSRNKTSGGGSHTHWITLGTHQHNVPIGWHGHTVSGTVGSTGSGTDINNVPLTRYYGLWKRTA